MKLFKSSIFAVLGLAVAMTACSDDKDHPDYSPAGAASGAYFKAYTAEQLLNDKIDPSSNDYKQSLKLDTYLVNDEMSSVGIEVYRTKDAASSYNLTATDTSGLFTIPSTVTFDASNLSTLLNISFEAEKLVEEVDYAITLKLDDQTSVGSSTYKFFVRKGSPMETESIGTGNWTYNCIWSGDDPGLQITKSYLPANPNKLTISVGNAALLWGGGVVLDIDVPDVTAVTKGTTSVFIHPQFTGYVHPTYGEVWIADLYSYFADYLEPLLGETYRKDATASYWTFEKGLFSMNLIYFIPKYGEGDSYIGNQTYEYLQLDGYPNYDIEVTYDGLFIKKNGNMTANATFSVGEDAESVKAVMVEGKDPQVGISAIQDESDEVQEFTKTGSFTAEFPVSKGGTYTIVATVIADGEIQTAAYDTFTINLNDDSADWDDIGNGSVIDGWIMAAFSINGQGIDVSQYPFEVPVQQHKTDKQLYRLVQPFGPNYMLNANNDFPANRNIEFHLAESMIFMQPQPSGFGVSSWNGELVIGNWAGYVEAQNPDVEYSKLKSFIISKGWEIDEYDAEEGYAMIVEPMHEGAQGFGYVWGQEPQPAYVFMPTASASTKAKVKAKMVAAPTIKGLSSTIRERKVKNNEKMVFARPVSTLESTLNTRKK